MTMPVPRLDPPPRSIVVFRALQLGDLLCSMPALRALRATYPAAHIAMVGLPTMEGFTRRYPQWIDEHIAFPGAPGFPEQAEDGVRLPAFVDAMRARAFDLSIQLHGNGGLANHLVASFGAVTMAGFHLPAIFDESASGVFVDWDAEPAEVRRYLALMAALGASDESVADTSIELPIVAAERDEWERLRALHGLDGRYVCIHPGARWSSRRWPLDRFAAVAHEVAARGARIVLTGSGDEREIVGALAERLRGAGVAVVDLAGRTSLGALACLLRGARLLVCNDTGISHVAAAVGTPSVVIASGSDVERWAPIDGTLHRVLAHAVPCRPCMHRDCPIDHPCAKGVTVEAVLDTAFSHPSLRPLERFATPFSRDRHAA